ncbi:MAG: hypothetical protein WDO74_36130 [Pseudomonadota bacterium]
MRPKVHNVVSYSGALLVFWGVLAWRAHELDLSFSAGLATALWSVHFVRRIWSRRSCIATRNPASGRAII